MIVGRQKYVEPGSLNGGEVSIGCTKGRVSCIGFAPKGYFEVADGDCLPVRSLLLSVRNRASNRTCHQPVVQRQSVLDAA